MPREHAQTINKSREPRSLGFATRNKQREEIIRRTLADTSEQTKPELPNQMNGGRNLVLSMRNSEGVHFVMPAWDNAPTKHLHECLMKLLMLRRVESRPCSRREKPFGQKQRTGNQEFGRNWHLWSSEEVPSQRSGDPMHRGQPGLELRCQRT